MKPRIALVGARGIGNYGGFETFVSELAPRLSVKGFEVYCTSEIDGSKYRGYEDVNIVNFPLKMPSTYVLRHLFEFAYDLYFDFYFSFKQKSDLIYFLGTTVNIFSILPRLVGKKSIVNMAGLEWKRTKFNVVYRKMLKLFFSLSLIGSNYLIIDNVNLIDSVEKKSRNKVVLISYGVNDMKAMPWSQTRLPFHANVNPDEFWLIVARLQPDNNVHEIIEAYKEAPSDKPLIIIGDYACSAKYRAMIEKSINGIPLGKKIIMAGGIYDQSVLNMIRQNAFGYIHPHSIGGTNPSLLEAMVTRNAIIANDNVFNREVAKDSVLYFGSREELIGQMKFLENNPEARSKLKQSAYDSVLLGNSWDKIADDYARLFGDMLLTHE